MSMSKFLKITYICFLLVLAIPVCALIGFSTWDYFVDQAKPLIVLTDPQSKEKLDQAFQAQGIDCSTVIVGSGRNNPHPRGLGSVPLARNLIAGPITLGECFKDAEVLADSIEPPMRKPPMYMQLSMSDIAGNVAYRSNCDVGRKECEIITPTARLIVPAEINYRNRALKKDKQ